MLDHKHLIMTGRLTATLPTGDDVVAIIHELVEMLGMKLLPMEANPNVGREKGEHGGVTGVGIITTSHIIIHTWDTSRKFQVDVYSCSTFDPRIVHDLLEKWGFEIRHSRFLDRNYDRISEV